MQEKKVTIALSEQEGLVLFEFLNRINQQSNNDVFEDQSEQRVLWDIVSSLESQLEKPLQGDYLKSVHQARDEVRDKE